MNHMTSGDLSHYPKIELHLHLDCSLSFEVVSNLQPSITRTVYEREFIAPPKCSNLADLLTRAAAGIRLIQNESALRLVTADLFRQLADDGIIYAEIRFAPLLHTREGLSPETVVEIVNRAVADAIAASGVSANLILCTLRHFSETQSLLTAKLVEHFRGSHVVALDLAADEAGYPLQNHIPAFRYVIERGIPRIAHAGEARGPESVWETLEHLQPSRIGHGVRSIGDPDLMHELREKQIHLEVCPSCNVQIDIFNTYADHPIHRLYEAGLSVGINTDARTMVNVTLSQEYERLQKTFGWQEEQFLNCNLKALKAAFLPEFRKASLRQRLIEGYSSPA